MNIKTLLRTGSAAAIAAALSFGALPTIAHAQDEDSYKNRRAEQREAHDRHRRPEPGGGVHERQHQQYHRGDDQRGGFGQHQDGSRPDAWRYVMEVQWAGKPADVTGYR